MVSISELILNKAYKGHITPQVFKSEGIEYVLSVYMNKVLGDDTFNNDDVEYMRLIDGLLVQLKSGELITVRIDKDDIIIDGGYFDAEIGVFDNGFDSSLTYGDGGHNVEDIYHVRENVFKKIRKIDGETVYAVSANSVGYAKSDRASYELRQEFPPVESKGLIGNIASFLKSQVNVDESRLGPTVSTYKELDKLLDNKIELEKPRKRVRTK